jgi:hypothetical protein
MLLRIAIDISTSYGMFSRLGDECFVYSLLENEMYLMDSKRELREKYHSILVSRTSTIDLW